MSSIQAAVPPAHYQTNRLKIAVDQAEVLRILEASVTAAPETLDHVFHLFFADDAPYEQAALVDYLFVIPASPAGRADDRVGLVVRDTNEFVSIISALYAEEIVGRSHSIRSLVGVVTPE